MKTLVAILVFLLVNPFRVSAEVVFSADFEDGQALAQTGEFLFRNEPVRRVDQTSAPDLALGDRVLLIDRETDQEYGLSFTLELASAIALAGDGAAFSFDYAVRRTNGASKTLLVTGWDTFGAPVFQIVLGDDNAFGNGQSDRQRPGYATSTGGATVLPAPNTPGSYRWGSDTTDDGFFDISKDAHISITVRESGWDLRMVYQGGANYSTLNLPTFDGLAHTDLERITVTNAEGTNFGGYWDNVLVEGEAIVALPSATQSIDIDTASQGRTIERWGYDIKQGGKAESLTPGRAQQLFVEDGFDLLRLPIWGDAGHPAHPEAGVVVESYYTATLSAIANARAANPGTLLFASKKLDGDESFPVWVKDADGDGFDDGNGIVPEKYAIMLADFLRYFESQGVSIHLLGIDNEERFNEGQITPQKHKETIDALRAIAADDPNLRVPQIIGTEDFDPQPDWVRELNENGWGDRADVFGTHYYRHRPFSRLADMAAQAGDKEFWNTEVHWDNLEPRDLMNEAEAALATFFDCTDLGMTGFSWWSYRRNEFKGGMQRALVNSTHDARPVPANDFDGVSSPEGSFITRAYRRGDTLYLWAINNHPSTDVSHQLILPAARNPSGPVTFTRWMELATFDGVAARSVSGEVWLAFPHRSITLLTIPIGPAEPQFKILQAARLFGGSWFLEFRVPQPGQPYHLQTSPALSEFTAIPRSTFVPDRNPYSLIVDGTVLGDSDRLFLRIASGAAP